MGNSWFQFQQFRVHQDRCAMKISTDAVLLGSLANAENPGQVLDIGAGTGVISLMLAQRYPEAQVTAIEIDPDAGVQANENFEESPFAARLQLVRGRVQDFVGEEKFTLIVSNPPFFPDHLKSADAKRNRALHTEALSFQELIDSVASLLAHDGIFWVILPPRQMQDLEILAETAGFFPFAKVSVRDSAQKAIYRNLVAFSFREKDISETEIILKNEDGTYSTSYSQVLSGFLLGY